MYIYNIKQGNKLKQQKKMENLAIISQANQLVKGANFTSLKKLTKTNHVTFLIVVNGNGTALSSSYIGNHIYAHIGNQLFKLV